MKINIPSPGDRIVTLALRDFDELITQLGWNYKGTWVPELKEEFVDFAKRNPPHRALQWLYGELTPHKYYDDWASTVKTRYNSARPSAAEVAIRFHPDLREEMNSINISKYETTVHDVDGDLLVKFAYCGREMMEEEDDGPHPAAYASRLVAELTGLELSVDTVGVPQDQLAECADLLIVRKDASTWRIARHLRLS